MKATSSKSDSLEFKKENNRKKIFSCSAIKLVMIFPNITLVKSILTALKLTCYSFPRHDDHRLLRPLRVQVMLTLIDHDGRPYGYFERVHNDCACMSN